MSKLSEQDRVFQTLKAKNKGFSDEIFNALHRKIQQRKNAKNCFGINKENEGLDINSVVSPIKKQRRTLSKKQNKKNKSSAIQDHKHRDVKQSTSLSSLFYLPDDVHYYMFSFLYIKDMLSMSLVSTECRTRISESMKHQFLKIFGEYPVNISIKNLFWIFKRLHDAQIPKNFSELFFWSCAKGYIQYISNICIQSDKINILKSGINAKSKVDDMTAVHICCRHSQLKVLKTLIKNTSIDINRLTKSKKHPIQLAIEKKDLNIVRWLAKQKTINLNTRDDKGQSAVFITAANGDYESLSILLEYKADPTVTDSHDRSPLFIASDRGHDKIVETLLKDENIDVEKASGSGKTPLYVCCENGHAYISRLLLEKGANVRHETCRAKIPLYVAAELGYADVVQELLLYTKEEDMFKLTHYGTTPMFIASKQANKTIKNLFIAFCTDKKKTKARAKKILASRQKGDKDPTADEFLIETNLDGTLPPRAATPRFMEHLERFNDHNKHRNKVVKQMKLQVKGKISSKSNHKYNLNTTDITNTSTILGSNPNFRPSTCPMSCRLTFESKLTKEEEIAHEVSRQDRSSLHLNLVNMARTLQEIDTENKNSITHRRPHSAVLCSQLLKRTNLKLENQNVVNRSKTLDLLGGHKSKPKKKRNRNKIKRKKHTFSRLKIEKINSNRDEEDKKEHDIVKDDIVKDESESPRISKNNWDDFLNRQKEKTELQQKKRLEKMMQKRDQLKEEQAEMRRKRDAARKEASKAANRASTQMKASKESEDELMKKELKKKAKIELRIKNAELAERARQRRLLKQMNIEIETDEKSTSSFDINIPNEKRKSRCKLNINNFYGGDSSDSHTSTKGKYHTSKLEAINYIETTKDDKHVKPKYTDTTPKLPKVFTSQSQRNRRHSDCRNRTNKHHHTIDDKYHVSDDAGRDHSKYNYNPSYQNEALAARAKAVITSFKQKKQDMAANAENIIKQREIHQIEDIKQQTQKRKKSRMKKMENAYGVIKKKKKKKPKTNAHDGLSLQGFGLK